MAKGDPVSWLFAHTHRLWLVLEGEHHGLREVGDLGVWHNNTQHLLPQDLAGILVLDVRWGERREGFGAEKKGPESPRLSSSCRWHAGSPVGNSDCTGSHLHFSENNASQTFPGEMCTVRANFWLCEEGL